MALLSIVVVPARDEEEHDRRVPGRARCADGRREHSRRSSSLDACPDDTAARAGDAAAERLASGCRSSPAPGAGAAPRGASGMDPAAERLRAARAADGLIACTDADTRPAPDWLERQLAHVRDGRRGRSRGPIELDPDEAAALPPTRSGPPRARRRRGG